ncbi:hypothetical protein C173_03239 [Paenibacillus sp. FSL R7-277]|uniref:hypothetical protein n=1 Tax=Paenibacillus sp. FSL R7-277 TaxID=1227352 RepID=UPI0003E236AB|nr:hypothetical protein [Paenibacillus sp. FSL R7-277]ETT77497.1 hypothetical protein C173_03239 [Paenibacillus sp. FSL R7-277]
MYKKPETKQEKYVGFPMKMNAYAHESLFIEKKDEYAFFLYFILGKMSQNYWAWGNFETTVITLSKQLPIKNKETENRKEIRRLLAVLNGRGWIKITFDDDSFEYDTLLTIYMVDLESPLVMDSVSSDNYKHLGYQKVTQEMFDACKGDPRHFRAMIYAEWRMFRSKENEGTYRISLGEWEKTMNISHATAVKLIKELDELNIVDKKRGLMYQDVSGKPKLETNQYFVVSEEERQKREENTDANGEPMAKEVNRYLSTAEANEYVTDERVKETNLFNPDRSVWLNAYDMYVFLTTKCEATLAHVNKRLDEMDKSRAGTRKRLEELGYKEKTKRDNETSAKIAVEEMSNYYVDSENTISEQDYAARYARSKANREAKAAEVKKKEQDELRLSLINEEIAS